MKNICLYAASSAHVSMQYYEAAYRMGELLARAGYGIINGAGKQGLMRAMSDGALDAGGTCIGVIPRFMLEQNLQYDRMTQMIVTDTMHERKQWMADHSAAIIALPGGYGTLEELAEIITWRQLKLHDNPVFILNTNGFFTHLLQWFSQAVEEGFVAPVHAHLWQAADTPEQILTCLQKQLQEVK